MGVWGEVLGARGDPGVGKDLGAGLGLGAGMGPGVGESLRVGGVEGWARVLWWLS